MEQVNLLSEGGGGGGGGRGGGGAGAAAGAGSGSSKGGGGSKGGGPSRGGVGGPCDHCARTSSPCWRKGPPEKPLLCNACGAHYLVKKSLDGYKPGQKVARPAGTSPARPRPRPKKKTEPAGGSALDSPFGGEMPVRPVDTNKRQRKANKKYLAGEEDTGTDTDSTTPHTTVSQRKPKGLSIRRVSRQDSIQDIVDTPMAANLLADMADRRKNQAPPPVWELTSPRGIEGARQRTFNALMGSPRPVRRMSSDGVDAMAMCPPPPLQVQAPAAPAMPPTLAPAGAPAPAGATVLAQYPYAKRTVLYGCDSPLPLIQMADVVNNKTWRAISTLAHSEASSMAELLPPLDRSTEPGASHGGVSSALFKSPAFQGAMANFQTLLASGMFDREGPNAGGSKVVDHFRRLHTETDLNASKWRETMPLVGKKRRAAKKRAADEYQALISANQGNSRSSAALDAGAPVDPMAAAAAPDLRGHREDGDATEAEPAPTLGSVLPPTEGGLLLDAPTASVKAVAPCEGLDGTRSSTGDGQAAAAASIAADSTPPTEEDGADGKEAPRSASLPHVADLLCST
mmetsp:Transcript_43866/g.110072  ORF Transcript_43866/g.110072 Transcript_43866/m.110072 type:complete len:570 (-) Transcript_43866:189-1898(-)